MQETRPFIPVGFRFRPSDEELIEDYLYKKVSGIPIPCVDYIVKECDLYGEHEPGEIWKAYGGPLLNDDDDLYFFTMLKKKTPKSSRINRRVGFGRGTWQGEDAPNDIVSSKSEKLIGSKKRFRYENDKSEDNGRWIMHEYTLDPSLLGQNQSTNYVLCRIRKNQPAGKSKKSSLAKKRKLQDLQNSNSSVEPERFLTQQEKKQVVCINSVECQYSEATRFTTEKQEASCNTGKMIDQSFKRRETGGIDYSRVAGAGQYEVPTGMAVPDQTTQTLSMVQFAEYERKLTQMESQQQWMCVNDTESRYEADLAIMKWKISSDNNDNFRRSETGGTDSISFAEQHEAPVSVVPDHQTVMLLPKESSDDGPLSGIPEEDFCMFRKIFPADEFDNQPIGKSGPGTSVDWVSMPCMQEMLCEVPKHMSEYVFVPSDDGERVDMVMNEKSFSDNGSEGIFLRSECVAHVPMALPDQTVVSEIPEHQHGSEENVIAPSTSDDRETMQSMSELPQLPSEENVIAPSDGESARSTSNSSRAYWKAIIDELVIEVHHILSENCGSNS